MKKETRDKVKRDKSEQKKRRNNLKRRKSKL
jgi:hypothetical protein